MNRILRFASVFFILLAGVSCQKPDDTDKLSANPLPYREDDAAGVFTVGNFTHAAAYDVHGEKVRQYTVEGQVNGTALPAGSVFTAGSLLVPGNQNMFAYSAYKDLDSTLQTVFGQEAAYSLGNGNGQQFSGNLKGPQPFVMDAPANGLQPTPIKVNRKTQIKWNTDPENSGGIVVEIKKKEAGAKNKFYHVADDGMLTLSSVWLHLPAKGSFTIGLHRGTHVTLTGNDSKKYIVNAISSIYTPVYETQGM